MRKWAAQVEEQRRKFLEATRLSHNAALAGASSTTLVSMNNLGPLENPYRELDEDEDDDSVSGYLNDGSYGTSFSIGRESNASFRSRSTTGDSGPSTTRVPPRQFPMGNQAPILHIQTQPQPQMSQPASGATPNEWIVDSYFSPTAESPNSTRSSGLNNPFPFPRQQMPPLPGWPNDEQNRFTAPALPRAQREGSMNGYQVNARNAMSTRPSLPPSSASASYQTMIQNRMRSQSSPDIQPNPLAAMRAANPSQPGVPDLPPFPQHYAYNPAMLNRTQTASPQVSGLPIRNGSQLAGMSQQGRISHPRSIPLQINPDYPAAQKYPSTMPRSIQSLDHAMAGQGQPEMRSVGPGSSIDSQRMTNSSVASSMRSPPMQGTPPTPPAKPHGFEDNELPTQFRVKVHCPTAGTSMTLVVMSNIEYETLKSRINQKLERSANLSLSSGQFKLKYKDDDDFVSIQSNEDVQLAFESWREQNSIGGTQFAEIDFYVQ